MRIQEGIDMEVAAMRAKEEAIQILEAMTEEQLEDFVALFRTMVYLPNAETRAVLEDVEVGRNLSQSFESVDALMEDLNADDSLS